MSRETTIHGLLNLDQRLFLPGEEVRTTLDFDGETALVQIKQAFRNPTKTSCAIAYLYPLPQGASSPRLQIVVEGKVEPPTQEEEEAWQQSAKAPPEEEPEDLFCIALDCLLPGQRLEVTLSYQRTFQQDDPAFLIVPPLNGPKRPTPPEPPTPPDDPEDIEKRLNQVILEMSQNLTDSKRQVAVAIADEKRLAKQAEASQLNAREWEKKAMSATQAGDADLAKEALARKEEYDKLTSEYQKQHQLQKAATNELQRALRALQNQIDEARRKKDVLVARKQNAEAKKQIYETARQFKAEVDTWLGAFRMPSATSPAVLQELQERLQLLEEGLTEQSAQNPDNEEALELFKEALQRAQRATALLSGSQPEESTPKDSE